MAHYNTVLSQLLVHIPRHHFDELVKTHRSDRYVKRFTTWGQFTTLLYAQASGKDSLRDIQNGLAAQSGKLYHLGLPDHVSRSTVSEANAKRPWQIYQSIFNHLLNRCRMVAPKHQFDFPNPLITFDSTTIELCLSLFPWAKFSATKGAIKLHYQLDHRGQIPSFMTLTEHRGIGVCHDLSIAQKHFDLIPDSIYCFDRGYQSFAYFSRIHEAGAFFVTRPRQNTQYRITGQQNLSEKSNVIADLTIALTGEKTATDYPRPMRMIQYYDVENQRLFYFITNNFKLPALTIALIYKSRWKIESFFKWIKQNLKLKTFLGTSKNAVLTQIWVAMCYYLLLAYIKFQTHYRFSLFYLHRMIKETLLERISLIDLIGLTPKKLARIRDHDPQTSFAF